MGKATVDLDAETGDYVSGMSEARQATQALAKHLGITNRQAKKLIGTHKGVAKQAKALAAAETQAAVRSRKLANAMGGARKVAEAMQGTMGSTISRLIGAGEAAGQFASVMGKAGPVGIAMAGFVATAAVGAVAMVKLNKAMFSFIHTQAELLDNAERMKAIGGIVSIDDDEVQALRRAHSAMTDIGDAASAIAFEIGAAMATDMADELDVAAAFAMDLASGIEDAVDQALDLGRHFGIIGNEALDWAEQMGLISKESANQVRFNRVMREKERDRLELIRKYGKTSKGVARTKRTEVDTAKELASLEADRLRAQQGLQDIIRSGKTGQDAINDRYLQEMDRIHELEQASDNAHLAKQARQVAEDRWREQSADLRSRMDSEELRAQEERAEARRRHFAEQQAQQEAAQEMQRRDTNAMLGGLTDLGAGIAGLARARAESMEQGTAAQKQAALEAFRIEQASAVAQAGIHGALAVTRTLAELGPIAGPIASVGIAATIAAQVGTILAQKPPAHLGSPGADRGRAGVAPDEAMIKVRNGEVVNTAQQAQRGQGAQQVIVARFENKFLDMTTTAQLRKDGALRREFDEGKAAGVTYGI